MDSVKIKSHNPEDEALRGLEKALGYDFKNRTFLKTALRHRSYVHQQTEGPGFHLPVEDNQRFEFLGDAVLSLAISTLLYDKFPSLKEGVLSRMRAGLVNELQLSGMARDIGIPEALYLGRGEESTGGREKNSILADAMEALLASIYLDGGFPAAMKVVSRLFQELIFRSSQDDLLKDFKTRLQEKTQGFFGQTPEYRLSASEGPDHARTFEVTLFLAGKPVSSGRGRSKKEAEQAAAKAGLDKIDLNELDFLH
ncbi:MAG: ribonuclease III [Pseudomonadota bacterium]